MQINGKLEKVIVVDRGLSHIVLGFFFRARWKKRALETLKWLLVVFESAQGIWQILQ